MKGYAIGILNDVDMGPPLVEYLERIDSTRAAYGDGGTLLPDAIAALEIRDDELSAFRFCSRDQAAQLLRPYVWRRAATALAALGAGRVRYLHCGVTVI